MENVVIFAYVTLMHFITVDPLISEPFGTKVQI